MTDFILRFLHYLKTNGDIKDFECYFNAGIEMLNIVLNNPQLEQFNICLSHYSEIQITGLIVEAVKNENNN